MTTPIMNIFKERYSAYNKDIVDIKSKFLQDFDANDYLSLLTKLGYGLDKRNSNYKWGKRIFIKEDCKLSWVSTNKDGYINIPLWDRELHCQVLKQIRPYISIEDVKHHVCSVLDKKSYLRLYRNNDFEPIKRAIKEESEYYKSALNNLQKINNKTFGLSQGSYHTLFFDIDNRNGKCATTELQKLLTLLNIKITDLLYLEQNYFTGGIHCAIKVKRLLPQNYQEIEKNLKTVNIDIECNFVNKLLRLPISFEYIPIKLSNHIDLDKEYIDKEFYINSFNEFKEQIIKQESVTDVKFLLNEVTAKETLSKNQQIINYWKSTPDRFIRDGKKHHKGIFYTIHEGKRWDTLGKLVPYCKALGYSLEDTAKIIKDNDRGSKDLHNMDINDVSKSIEKFYNTCNVVPNITIKRHYNGFISNKQHLNEYSNLIIHNEYVIDLLVKKFNYFYCKRRNMKTLSEEKLNVLRMELPLFFEEIIGKMFYDIKTHKRFRDNRYNYLNGFQLPDEHLIKIQDYIIDELKLNDNPLAKTSLQYLKNALLDILKYLGVQEIITNPNKRNWINGCCKTFVINQISTINDIMTNLTNKLVNLYYNYFYKKLFSKNTLNTYNISLVENTNVQDIRDKKWITNNIPIPI